MSAGAMPMFRRSTLVWGVACAAVLIAVSVHAADAVRGVTDTEIVLGTITDLSGIAAIQGVNNTQAVRMAFDEVNERGGIHGRKIKYIVEDTSYQVPRAVQALNKLLNRDRAFALVSNLGTPLNNANLPTMIENNLPNVFPLTPARSMFEPFNRMKFSSFASYNDQMRAGVKHFVEQKGKKRICAMYQDTDFGREVLGGVIEQTKTMGLELVGQTTHKPTDTDFTAYVQRLKEAGCDLVVTATSVRDTTLILSTARKIGWDTEFLGQFGAYDRAVAEAPGGVGEGYYVMTPALYAYPDDPRPAVQQFARKYKERFGIEPSFAGELGYSAAQMTIVALEQAGRNLTMDRFIEGLESIRGFQDIFGSPPVTLSATQHQGSSQAWLAVVKNGRWTQAVEHPLGY